MGRKTLILTENQFNEICGTNTSYLDNDNDYAEDGLTTTKTGGAVSDSNGEKEYSEPLTTDDYAHELAPETLFALLFRNGGHGLWGHWGSGLRADVLDGFDNKFDFHDDEDEEYDDEDGIDETDPDKIRAEIERLQSILDNIEDNEGEDDDEKRLNEETDGPTNDYFDWDEQVYYEALKIMKKFDFGQEESVDAVEHIIDVYINSKEPDNKLLHMEPEEAARYVAREAMKSIDRDYYESEVEPFMGLNEGKKKLQESNGELEDRTWRLDLDNDGLKKTYSYTNLTTKKTELKQLLAQLVQQNAPKKQIQRVKSSLAGICRVLDRETGAIKQRKTNRKNLGFTNQFQKEGGKKNSGNGKAHSKKIKDPNVGTGYITYA